MVILNENVSSTICKRESFHHKHGSLLRNIILNSVRQHSHFITQGNYKATCFDYRLVILRHILSIVSQDAMHTLCN